MLPLLVLQPQNLAETPPGQGILLINGLIKGGGDVVTGQIYYDYDVN